MLGRTDSRVRLLLLLCSLAVFASALGLRLAYWQIDQGDELRRLAEQQLSRPPTEAYAQRGEITDRRGTVLATTAYRDLLAAYPDMMSDSQREEVTLRLIEILGLGEDEAAELTNALAPDVPYVIVARRLTLAQSELIRAGMASEELIALDLDPQPVRFYPNSGGSPDTTLASQLLGFVTDDGRGRYGIEQYGQDVLAGESGPTAVADGALLPQAGADVQLTIDASLQLRLEKELYAAWVADRAKRVTGLVMDPYTGAVLAWASVPGYDANEYPDTAEQAPDLFVDPIVSEVYEPGSVMKMLTAAAALEEGVVELDTPIEDDRVLRIGTNVVRNGDLKSIGTAPFEDIIARSRNVATGKVALMLGDTTDASSSVLYSMWERLGIGRRTGIDLGNESAGLVDDPVDSPWQDIDLVNRAFGQGVAVTPLQLATAYSAMVNGGALPVPHLISALGADSVEHPAAAQVIDPSLSEELRRLMVHVVEAGAHYAQETLIPGYVVGGKTGTAQIWDNGAGAWKADVYNHTFVGFVGAERPEAVILVRIHETKPRIRHRWGMSLELTSNELFRRVALDTIAALDIAPLFAPPPPTDSTPTPTDPGPEETTRPPSTVVGWH